MPGNANSANAPGLLKNAVNLDPADQGTLVNTFDPRNALVFGTDGNTVLSDGNYNTSTQDSELETLISDLADALGISEQEVARILDLNGLIFATTQNAAGDVEVHENGVGRVSPIPSSLEVGDVVDLGDGNDTIFAGGGNDILLGGDGNDQLMGEAGDDFLFGEAGNDTLVGGADDDYLAGGAGRDHLDGGAGEDTADYSQSDAAVAVSLLADTASGGHAEGDELDNIENLIGSAFDDTLEGDNGDNVIDGRAGDDVINGHDGANRLDGGAGNDVIHGGSDRDTINGFGTAFNREENGDVILDASRDQDVIDAGDGDGIVRGDGIVGAFGIKGSATLIGGDDTINAGAGGATLQGDGGVSASVESGEATMIGGDDIISAGADRNIIIGDGTTVRANALNGVATNTGGSDILHGGGGDDTIIGEGSALAEGNNGVVTIYGAGDDLHGDEGDDALIGDGSASTSGGYSGTSTVNGGNDTLNGGMGNDTLIGDGLALAGENGTATLNGGDDVLNGGDGNDELTGDGLVIAPASLGGVEVLNGGADTFVFDAADGLDTITDFRSTDDDMIDLSPTTLAWADLDSNDSGALDDADDHISGVAGGDTVIDLGEAAGGAAEQNVVTVENVTGLVMDDFVFA